MATAAATRLKFKPRLPCWWCGDLGVWRCANGHEITMQMREGRPVPEGCCPRRIDTYTVHNQGRCRGRLHPAPCSNCNAEGFSLWAQGQPWQ